MSSFVRDYLSVKLQGTPAMNKVYFVFKNYVEENNIETENLLIDLLSYARWYHILLNGSTKDKRLNSCIYRLNRLETTVTRPFFLEVIKFNEAGFLNMDDVVEIFLTTENYLFRRIICDLPTNMLNKIFLLLHKEILRYDKTHNDYVEKLKYTLTSKKERARFPDEDEFGESFVTKQIYLMNSKNKIYLLKSFDEG